MKGRTYLDSICNPYLTCLHSYIEGNLLRVAEIVVYGDVAISAGLVSLGLPETAGKNLPDKIWWIRKGT